MKIKQQKWYRSLFRRRVVISAFIIFQALIFLYIVLASNRYSTYISIALNALSFLVALGVIAKPGNSAYKMSWVFLILVFPVFGGLFYLFVTGQTSTKMFGKKLSEIGEKSKEMFKLGAVSNQKAEKLLPKYASQMRYLERTGFPVYENVYTKYLTPGEEKFKHLLEELKKAKKYIFLEYFIIQEGKMWNSVLEILKQKAEEGVDVRIMYDDIGCFLLLPANYPKKLREMGIKCIVFNPFRPFFSSVQNNRDHRKIVSIDGKVAFTGGINLADEYINEYEKHGHWKDASVMTYGDAAWGLTLIFLQMWEIASGKSENYIDYYPTDSIKAENSDGFIIPYADSPLDSLPVSADVYNKIITSATEYIYITTPYLIIDEIMMKAFKTAVQSGVDVRIITPHRWDKRFVHFTTRSYYKELIDAGVKIYEYKPGFIHSKTFVSDDTVATVGTANLDFRSLYLHFECGTCIYSADAVWDVKEDFIKTLDKSIEITHNDCKKNLFIRIMQNIFRLVAPLM
ncbi:MAG: cardiolipin synthase [Ruminococcaceae bacterium]|nr:cardiolipin synthase [Oscillospiraceae bacterium]